MKTLTMTHWSVQEVEMRDGRGVGLRPFAADPDPSRIGLDALSPEVARLRVRRPAVRESWLRHGPGAATDRRGEEAFVEISWDRAEALVAAEIARVRAAHGNEAIFGGSYGWSSAGRFHHAQSQVHRFLNAAGGYVRHMDSYSLGAARVLMPHIVAPMEELFALHTSWDVLAEHTKLMVTFGGVPAKNSQVQPGGTAEHRVRDGLRRMRANGARFVNVTPTADDLDTGGPDEWIPIRPNTDTAMLLALAYTLYSENLHDPRFLDRCCVGFEKFASYLTGATDGIPKDPRWAAAIAGVPAEQIASLAREMAAARTMLNISWSLQRAHHGEQPFWALTALACMLGQVGLPGGGFGVGYGAYNLMGSPHMRLNAAALPQGVNPVKAFIPVARIADMFLNPGGGFEYNGGHYVYPDIRMVYWAGGNPFHHHQDLNRFRLAWRKPDTIVVNEQFWTRSAKMADIVLPATTSLERNDIGTGTREKYIVAMKSVSPPVGEARDDYAIFAAIARRLGVADAYTEGLDADGWLRRLWAETAGRAARAGIALPEFDIFWEAGLVELPPNPEPVVMFAGLRADPAAHPLKTPSGKIEIFSERIASFGYDDCPGHPAWFEPAEWLGGTGAGQYPLHLLSDQPADKLHSQLDHSRYSMATKVKGRQPVTISPEDAAARGIGDGDIVRVFNDRGACLAAARVSGRIRQGVARLSTGAWFDPSAGDSLRPLEKHGNPNAVTLDMGASKLSQGCVAQTCLVQIERFEGIPPPVTAHETAHFVPE